MHRRQCTTQQPQPPVPTPRAHSRRARTFAAVCGLSAAAIAPRVQAADCAPGSDTVIITGSTAVKPLIAELAKLLAIPSAADAGATPAAPILYAGAGSCAGVSTLLSGTALTGELTFWDPQGNEQTCSVASALSADIAVSDVFASSCLALPNGLPSNIQDFLGPVQTMTFVVPKGSTQGVISAEAAYYVFGFGSESGVLPWTDESFIIRRNAESGTQSLLGAAIGVPAALWKGTAAQSSSDLAQRVIAAGNVDAEATIGILAADDAHKNRSTLDVLAYQHFGQSCGFYPDRDASSNEQQNVRDGNYVLWGPMHLLTTVDNNQRAAKPGAGDIIAYLIGTKPAPVGLDLVSLQAQHRMVPQCAMQVARTREMGPLTPFRSGGPCGCYYEKVANGATSCAPCTSANECGTSGAQCSYGYCEATAAH